MFTTLSRAHHLRLNKTPNGRRTPNQTNKQRRNRGTYIGRYHAVHGSWVCNDLIAHAILLCFGLRRYDESSECIHVSIKWQR